MQWPITLRFEQRMQPMDTPEVRREPGERDEWQLDPYYLVARSWDEYALIHVASENVRDRPRTASAR